MEFALVLPMLLVLLLGIADFGRVFSAGITLEAAARNGAEAAAQEYVQLVRNKPSGLDAADYQHLHEVALEAVCEEAEVLPNRVESGGTCTMPVAAACIHDGNDANCGAEADPTIAGCQAMNAPGSWNPASAGPDPGGTGALVFVEVQVCYRFTTLINVTALDLPFGWGLSIGDIWLERDRSFTAACYPDSAGPCS